MTQIRWGGKWVHLAYIWIVSHLSAKNYRNLWKFDEVLTKTNLLSFFGTRCRCNKNAFVAGAQRQTHFWCKMPRNVSDSWKFRLISVKRNLTIEAKCGCFWIYAMLPCSCLLNYASSLLPCDRMQCNARYCKGISVRLSVYLSVCQTRALWQNERNLCPHSHTSWKIETLIQCAEWSQFTFQHFFCIRPRN